MHISPHRRERAPLVEINPAEDKIIAAIHFVVEETERRDISVTQYDVVKTIFLADKNHLNVYGRPVVFDNYRAMEYGPVPSLAYSLLKGETHRLRQQHISQLPWKVRKAPEINSNANVYYEATPNWGDDILSESDTDSLRDALTTVKSLTFGQIKRLTHEDPAYVEAWDPDVSANNLMSYALLFENPNPEQAEIVMYLSQSRDPINR